MGNSDNVIGYIEYLSDDGKIIGYVTPFTDVDKFRKEILEAAEVGMPITPVVFPDKLDKPLLTSFGRIKLDMYFLPSMRKPTNLKAAMIYIPHRSFATDCWMIWPSPCCCRQSATTTLQIWIRTKLHECGPLGSL